MINQIATLGKFFFAIAGLMDCHWLDPVATFALYFNLNIGNLC
ncbi:hypothetical protein BFG60_3098 [Microcystis aeruginosa NIES-98]|nr:hypothetical protein BFG60_3098 [Microcystis aeruginosa NIES-98]